MSELDAVASRFLREVEAASEFLQDCGLLGPHGGFRFLRVVFKSEKMKNAMDGEQAQLVGYGVAADRSLQLCEWEADDDIAVIGRIVVGIDRSIAEGKHIRWFVGIRELQVELAHTIFAHEYDADLPGSGFLMFQRGKACSFNRIDYVGEFFIGVDEDLVAHVT